MAFRKRVAAVVAPKNSYEVLITGFLAGTHRTAGDIVKMSANAARYPLMSRHIGPVGTLDAKKTKASAKPVEAAPATPVTETPVEPETAPSAHASYSYGDETTEHSS